MADHYREAYRLPTVQLPVSGSAAEATEAGPAETAEARAQSEELRAALSELTPEQEEVIVLKFILGYENERIAAITGRTIGAVKSMQYRGLATLNRRLGAAKMTWN